MALITKICRACEREQCSCRDDFNENMGYAIRKIRWLSISSGVSKTIRDDGLKDLEELIRNLRKENRERK